MDLFDWINKEFLQLSSLIPTSGVNCIRALEWRRTGSSGQCPASLASFSAEMRWERRRRRSGRCVDGLEDAEQRESNRKERCVGVNRGEGEYFSLSTGTHVAAARMKHLQLSAAYQEQEVEGWKLFKLDCFIKAMKMRGKASSYV